MLTEKAPEPAAGVQLQLPTYPSTPPFGLDGLTAAAGGCDSVAAYWAVSQATTYAIPQTRSSPASWRWWRSTISLGPACSVEAQQDGPPTELVDRGTGGLVLARLAAPDLPARGVVMPSRFMNRVSCGCLSAARSGSRQAAPTGPPDWPPANEGAGRTAERRWSGAALSRALIRPDLLDMWMCRCVLPPTMGAPLRPLWARHIAQFLSVLLAAVAKILWNTGDSGLKNKRRKIAGARPCVW